MSIILSRIFKVATRVMCTLYRLFHRCSQQNQLTTHNKTNSHRYKSFVSLYTHLTERLHVALKNRDAALVEWLVWSFALDLGHLDAEFVLRVGLFPLIATGSPKFKGRAAKHVWKVSAVRAALFFGSVSKEEVVEHMKYLSRSYASYTFDGDEKIDVGNVSIALSDEDDELVGTRVVRDSFMLIAKEQSLTKSTLLLLVFYDPGRKRDRVLVASLIKQYPEDCVAVFAVPSEAREICQSFQVLEPFPTVVLKQGGVEVTRLDRDVTLENVKQSVAPFLTDEMKNRLKESNDDEDVDDDQDEKEEEETIQVSVKKNALERFWMTHPSLLSIGGTLLFEGVDFTFTFPKDHSQTLAHNALHTTQHA